MTDPARSARRGLRDWPQEDRGIQGYMDPTFSTIAPRYDFMTRALSFGQEQRRKREAVALIPERLRSRPVLDLACGTGDFPWQLRRAGFEAPILALDRNPEMLRLAAAKCRRHPGIEFVQGDLTALPVPDARFGTVTMGYALRYASDVAVPLREAFRALEPGGMLVCLEFGRPRNRAYRRLCHSYLLSLGSLWGLLLHRRLRTYWHIVESLRAYPGQEVLRGALEDAGFRQIVLRERMGGILTILTALRPSSG